MRAFFSCAFSHSFLFPFVCFTFFFFFRSFFFFCFHCQITSILDLVGGDASSITDTCNTVSNAMEGTYKTLIGCFILIVSQIIVIAYWYK